MEDPRNQWFGDTFFYGLASISVQDWRNNEQANLADLRAALSHPSVVGIKLAFAHTLTPFDDQQYYSVYDLAEEMDQPVYHHVGTSPLRKASAFEDNELEFFARTFDPQFLEEAIAMYPKVKFILGHIGHDTNDEGFGRIEEALRIAAEYPNAYLEISAFGSPSNDPDNVLMDSVMRRVLADGLVEKTIYGSDGPQFPGNTSNYKDIVLNSMARVGYSIEDARKIMAGNARTIFGIPE